MWIPARRVGFLEVPAKPYGAWWRQYLGQQPVVGSSITVMERIQGYSLLRGCVEDLEQRESIEKAQVAYLLAPKLVVPMDGAMAAVAGEILALVPDPPDASQAFARACGVANGSLGSVAIRGRWRAIWNVSQR